MKQHPRLTLSAPINYEALSCAYQKARWNWWFQGGRRPPSARDIQDTVEYLITDARKDTQFRATGGIYVQIVAGNPIISISHQLAIHYEGMNHDYQI